MQVKMACRGKQMRRLLALWCMSCGSFAASSSGALLGQTPDPAQVNAAAPNTATTQPTIYRDPYTGQLYQQEIKTVEQPVTTWQRKLVDRTVVTPQTVIENQQVPQVSYVAKTEYVLQSKLKGWWNPFAQPTYAYEYVPVTRWVPQTQMVTRQVPTVKMLAKTEQVPVDEPVQTTQKVTQVVMRPLPAGAPAGNVANNMAGVLPPGAVTTNQYAANVYGANTRATSQLAYQAPPYQRPAPVYTNANAYGRSNAQPLVASVPLFGRQPTQTFQPGTLLTAPMNGLRDIVRATTAPFKGQSNYSSYAQPMNIASQPNANWGRDFNQAGMPATVVR